MAHLYKEPRVCVCGYSTKHRSNFASHQRICKERVSPDIEKVQQLKEEVGHLREQLETKDQQLEAKDKQIAELIRMANREQKRRIKGSIAKKRSEPEKRRIAMRQNWKCVNPDGTCPLRGDLREYEVDHIIPSSLGGADTDDNLQALCPACHREKTNRENQERGGGGSSDE